MRRSPLLPIFLIVLVDVLGLTLMLPLLPFYAERFGASAQVVGLLVSTYALCQLISGPLLGRASDRIGRRPLLLLSQLGTFVGFGVLFYAQALWMVFLSRIIDGSTAGNLSLAQAYIADVTEPQNRARAFGIIGIAFGVGFLVGPAISGRLAAIDFRYPVIAAAALSATSILCTYFLLPSGPPAGPAKADESPGPGGRRLRVLDWGAYVEFFRRPRLFALLVQFFLFAFAFSTFVSGFALFAERRFVDGRGAPWGPRQVGYVFAYAGLLGIILQGGLLGRLVKRFGESRLAATGFLSAGIGYGVLGLSRTVPSLLSAATLSSYGNGTLRPTLTSLVTQCVGRREQGTILGLTQSLMSITQIIGPFLAGLLIQHRFLTTWGFWAAALALLGLLVRPRPAEARAAEVTGSP